MSVENSPSTTTTRTRPITFEMADDLQPAEMVCGKNLRFSILHLLNNSYQENLLSECDISELIFKSTHLSLNKGFVSEKDFEDYDSKSSIMQAQACTSNMVFALYNAMVLLYKVPPISLNSLAALISTYSSNVDLENIMQSRNILKPCCFVDEFLVKYYKRPYVFPFWSTRYDSIYSIFKALANNYPVLVRVNAPIYHNTLCKNNEHYVVLVGIQKGKAVTVDSSVKGLLHYCPIGSFLYSMAPDNDNACAWDLSLLL